MSSPQTDFWSSARVHEGRAHSRHRNLCALEENLDPDITDMHCNFGTFEDVRYTRPVLTLDVIEAVKKPHCLPTRWDCKFLFSKKLDTPDQLKFLKANEAEVAWSRPTLVLAAVLQHCNFSALEEDRNRAFMDAKMALLWQLTTHEPWAPALHS